MAYGRKTGGRQKGTPNKTTAFGKSVIQDILNGYTSTELFKEDLKSLEPKDRLDIMVKLMSFTTPKPQSVSMNLSGEKQITIEEKLIMLSSENEDE